MRTSEHTRPCAHAHKKCPWDGGAAIEELDIPSWVRRFRYEIVGEDVLGPNGAIHALTTHGKQLQLGEWEILIAKDFKPYLDFVLVHEAVENWLRRRGWLYASSHEYSEHVEDELFLQDSNFAIYRQL